MTRHADSLALLWQVAEIEAQHLGWQLIEPAHYFLAMLKVVDVDLHRVINLRDKDATAHQITKDVADLRLAFDRADVETTLVRRRLRNRLRKSGNKKNGHLHRSLQSRTVFRISEAFAKSHRVKPIHLLSILIEASIPGIDEVLQDSTLNRNLLLEASTKIAISDVSVGEARPEESLLLHWERTFHKVGSQGWSVSWMRFVCEDTLFWRVQASKDGMSHIVQGEEIAVALVELDRSICG